MTKLKKCLASIASSVLMALSLSVSVSSPAAAEGRWQCEWMTVLTYTCNPKTLECGEAMETYEWVCWWVE
jgi:hypothetical protein